MNIQPEINKFAYYLNDIGITDLCKLERKLSCMSKAQTGKILFVRKELNSFLESHVVSRKIAGGQQ